MRVSRPKPRSTGRRASPPENLQSANSANKISHPADAPFHGGASRKESRTKTKPYHMKKTLLVVVCSMLASAAILADEKTTTVTSTGTISEYSPGTTFVIKETSGPVTYHYGKTVTYVTKKGKALTDDEVRTRIRVGAPVTVHYLTEGNDRVISRVEVDED